MKYVIQLFSLLCFSMLATVSMAQINQSESSGSSFDELFTTLNGQSRETGGGGGGGLSSNPGGSGGGGNDSIIGIDWSSKKIAVLGEDYTLNWDKVKGKDSYIVQVAEQKRGTNLNLIYVANVKSNSIVLPFGNLDLDESKTYFVRVLSADGVAVSKKGLIHRVDDSVYHNAIKAVKEDSRYKSGTKLEKIMMKAWALEKAGLVMDAYKYYNKYMEDKGDDNALRNMKEIFVKAYR